MPRLPQHLTKGPVGRQQLSRAELSRHQREKILGPATGVFAKRGYQGTTVDNIVSAAGIGVGSFYSHFDGKEDCFLAVYDRILASTQKQVSQRAAYADGWARMTYLGLAQLLEIFLAEPLSARIVLVEVQTVGSAGAPRYNGLMDAAVEWLRGGRDHYQAAAELPQTYELAAVSGLAFFLHQQLLSGQAEALEALLAETAQMVLEPILGKDEYGRLRREPAISPS